MLLRLGLRGTGAGSGQGLFPRILVGWRETPLSFSPLLDAFGQVWRLIPMTHAPETGAGAENRLRFQPPVSGTCVMQIWDRIRLLSEIGAE